uniref:Uncharacterized protein n=1 Tax=Cucumis melo TaxID=3656 RepID=A0A9I9ELK8_CUCME
CLGKEVDLDDKTFFFFIGCLLLEVVGKRKPKEGRIIFHISVQQQKKGKEQRICEQGSKKANMDINKSFGRLSMTLCLPAQASKGDQLEIPFVTLRCH